MLYPLYPEIVDMATHPNKILLLQLGSPASLKTSDVRSYLKDFLGDPRVVDLPAWWWKIILYAAVLPFRPAQSARAYARIWQGDGFPLPKITGEFAREVQGHLPGVDVQCAFLLGRPNIQDVWDTWEKRGPVGKILAIPLFPQYCEGTVASAVDAFCDQLKNRVNIPSFEFLTSFHRARAFIDGGVENIHRHLQDHPVDALVISFHGIPIRRILSKGDLYYRHCWETFCLLQEGLRQKGQTVDIHFTFQSRFGSEEWLGPYTDRFCCDLAARGVRQIAVYCPSFVADCLETTDEIGHELGSEVKKLSGEISLIPCLNTEAQWCADFAELARRHLEAGQNEQHELYHQQEFPPMPEQTLSSPPLNPEAKSTLKMVFATLFLDLVGFSIIFPLFPALAKHYLEVDGDNPFLRLIFDGVARWASAGGGDISSVVLFGSALGALYSFLQFVAAPLWGTLSDKIGRRPVLITSLVGLTLSYALWFFSGSFTLLIIARFIGGIMAGNISTATAVVGDITERQNRSKGMAIVGVAFALGFILGPALGGVASLIDLSALFPEWRSWGVNPFSLPALVAFVLSAVNLAWVARRFPETLPPARRGQKTGHRSANLWQLFRPLPWPGFNLTNLAHFLFLLAFSGMEFTLTFLAVERLSYSGLDNAYMFIFIGVLIALVQGGYVRRKAAQVGEKRMALQGLVLLIPGLLAIAWASSSWALYGGLFFLSIGSAMAIPCLTALISLYTPAESQGQGLGIFRSLGALARVIGPLAAGLLYWSWGGAFPYLLGAAFLGLPIAMVACLPTPKK